MSSQSLRAKMKTELRKALEAELDQLSARVDAIKVLLETSGEISITRSAKREGATEPKKTDGRKLRWQNATPEQRKAWASAIKTGHRSRKGRKKYSGQQRRRST